MTLDTLPATEADRWRRIRPPVAVIGGLGLATLALRFRDPHEHGSWGWCPSAALGFSCPGCGGLRAVNDLTHGRLLDAFSSNPLIVSLMPVAIFLLGRWFLDRWRGVRREHTLTTSTPILVGLLAVTITFGVLRNLPGFGYLAP